MLSWIWFACICCTNGSLS